MHCVEEQLLSTKPKQKKKKDIIKDSSIQNSITVSSEVIIV